MDNNNHRFKYSKVDLNQILLDGTESVIFTSATLKINDGFNYFSSALGLNLIEREKKGKSLVVSPVFKLMIELKYLSQEICLSIIT